MKAIQNFVVMAAAAGVHFNLFDFVDNELLMENNMARKEKFLKRVASTLVNFKRKQVKQKGKVCFSNSVLPHTYARPVSNYRKNRDIQIYKLSKTSSIKNIIKTLWSCHPFYSDKTCVKYVERCIKCGCKTIQEA